jgi:hypothetical protein
MKSSLEYFEEKVIPEPNTGCWLWCAKSYGVWSAPRWAEVWRHWRQRVADRDPQEVEAHRVGAAAAACQPAPL